MAKTYYIWDDDAVIAETDDQGTVTASYNRQPDQFGSLNSETRAGETYHHHYDGLGSTTELTDSSEEVTDTFRYSAFGEEVSRIGTTETPYTWVGKTGYQSSPSSHFYIRRRHYSAPSGKWISEDPYYSHWPQNFYGYANNNPLSLIDPSGLFCVPLCESAVLNVATERTCNLQWVNTGRTPGLELGMVQATKIDARFGPDCTCCEYRQFLQGYIRHRVTAANGTIGNWQYDLNEPVWSEDISPTSGRGYGHRAPGTDLLEAYHDNGCKYYAEDYPGFWVVPLNGRLRPLESMVVEMRLEFWSGVVDVCNALPLWPGFLPAPTLASKSWSVNCSARFPMSTIIVPLPLPPPPVTEPVILPPSPP